MTTRLTFVCPYQKCVWPRCVESGHVTQSPGYITHPSCDNEIEARKREIKIEWRPQNNGGPWKQR